MDVLLKSLEYSVTVGSCIRLKLCTRLWKSNGAPRSSPRRSACGACGSDAAAAHMVRADHCSISAAAVTPLVLEKPAIGVGLLAIGFAVLAITVQSLALTDEARVAHLLSTRHKVSPPSVDNLVRRPEIDEIIRLMTGNYTNFLVVEGGNRMGKSTAVAMAVSELSDTVTVFSMDAAISDNVETFLRRMLSLTREGLWEQLIAMLPVSGRAKDVESTLMKVQHTLPQVSTILAA